jgi:hypothetical protein
MHQFDAETGAFPILKNSRIIAQHLKQKESEKEKLVVRKQHGKARIRF